MDHQNVCGDPLPRLNPWASQWVRRIILESEMEMPDSGNISEFKLYLKSRAKITQSGCWEWIGTRNKRGYGVIRVPSLDLIMGVHRFSHLVFIGDLTKDCLVMHLCDNPPCFNPKHMKEGTHKENMAHAAELGRIGGKRPGAGRPCLPKSKRRSVNISLRLTPSEYYVARKCADERGVRVPDVIRETITKLIAHECAER